MKAVKAAEDERKRLERAAESSAIKEGLKAAKAVADEKMAERAADAERVKAAKAAEDARKRLEKATKEAGEMAARAVEAGSYTRPLFGST